jgi:aspartate/methionine/tyrosine aminotransferase|tara:strand:+ start:12091 stop:13245 length:1155 start_codon:yes stop_codon:yes gene_type:complete
VPYRTPWSARHKAVTAGLPYNLSTSFTEPLSNEELIKLSVERGDQDIVDAYYNHSLEYTPNGGSYDIREEIANLYGSEICADNIVVFAGGQVAIQTAAITLLDESTHSITFTPGYQSVQEAPIHAGSEVTKIKLYPENNWQINPEKVKEAIRPDTKYISFNEPYNPAGTLMKANCQLELVNLAEKNDIYILSDEVYRLLEHDASDRLPAMADIYSKGISAVTMSKPWGGCGITIGWLAFQELALRQKLIDTMYFHTACPSRASEIQGIMTLRASDQILAKNMKIIRHNIKLLDQFIKKYSDFFEWIRPNAGAICYMKFKGPLSSDELGAELGKVGISIKPSYVFSENSTYDSDYFRVGFGEKVFPKALEVLTQFVEENKNMWCA